MFSSKSLWLTTLVAVTGLLFASCDKEKEDEEKVGGNAVISIFSDNGSFNEAGKATVNLVVSGTPDEDIVATIAAGSQAEEGYTAVSALALDFESSVTIEKGTKSVALEVSVDLFKAAPGQEAVITIASATGAMVDETANTVFIKLNATNGPVEGASEWSVIGTVLGSNWDTDFVADETEGIFVVKNIRLTADSEFKFRFQKDWTVNRGGEFTEFGKGFACEQNGANVKVGVEGVYDIYYNSVVEQIGVVTTGGEIEWGSKTGSGGSLDWTIQYAGTQWVEGYYGYGQLEVLNVSGTDTPYYHLLLVDLSEEDDYLAALTNDHDATIAALQEELEEAIADEMEYYEETREEALPYILYSEENDGTEILFYGQPIGDYQFVILPANENGELDGRYAVISFTKDTDPETTYDWGITPQLNPNWTAAWDGWCEGEEGEYYWVVGSAAGAAYVVVDSYTDEELEKYHDGSVANMLNTTQTSLSGYLDNYTLEDLAYYGVINEVASDGSFESSLSTYDITGPTYIYIIGLDAAGNVLNDYGKSEVEIPEYVEEPIEWSERTDWALNYDATVDTGDTTYSQAVVVTACDADYFVTTIWEAGSSQEYTLDEIGADALYYVTLYGAYGYTVDDLVEYEIVHNSVPAVEGWKGLENGMEAFVFGITSAGKLTGEWHMEVLTGIEEIPQEELEMTLQTNWSVTTVGEAYVDGDGYDVIDIEVDCPGILWYAVEENTPDDLDTYYDGSIAGFALSVQEDLADYLGTYTIDELLYSGADPQPSTYVYNFDTPTTIYIVEFDEDGKPTGRYGATDVTIPTPSSASSVAVRIHRSAKHNSVRVSNRQPVKPQANRPVLQKKVRKAIVHKHTFSIGRSQAAAAKTQKIRKAVLR